MTSWATSFRARRPRNPTTYLSDDDGRVISTTDANSKTASTKYDVFGEVIDQTDATGQVTSYRYDFDGRQTAWRWA